MSDVPIRHDGRPPRVEEFRRWVEPIDALRAAGALTHPALLLSGAPDHPGSRFSILAADPILVCEVRGRSVRLSHGGPTGAREDVLTVADPFRIVHELAPGGAACAAPGLPFSGGAIGCLGYGLRHAIEDLPDRLPEPLRQPDAWFGVHDTAVVFDHRERRVAIVAAGLEVVGRDNAGGGDGDGEGRRERCLRRWHGRLEEAARAAAGGGTTGPAPAARLVHLAAGHDHYLSRVRRVLEYIAAGDVYQVNLSHRVSCRWTGDPVSLFAELARRNPSPFAGYLDAGDLRVLSTSPERLVALRGDRVVSSPIKGTRPRRSDPLEDRRLARELCESPKDRAENVMIADLVRNDLGRVCRPGSIRVESLCGLESFASVHHLVSTVSGMLAPEQDRAAVLRALFPGGSMTGAPKVRAMEIIDELEEEKRGLYSGSLGYVSSDGGMDFNIVIRTLVNAGDDVHFRIGGGIVADSVPEEEWRETLDKGRALLDTLGATLGSC